MQIREKGSKLQFLRAEWDGESKRTRQKMVISVGWGTKKLTDEQIAEGQLTDEEVAQFDARVKQSDEHVQNLMENYSLSNVLKQLKDFEGLIKRGDRKALKQTDVNKLDKEMSRIVILLNDAGYHTKNLNLGG